jgi:putative transposase
MSTRRKLIRHFHNAGDCHELTFSCYARRPLLADQDRCRLLADCLGSAVDVCSFRLVGFIFMPEHVHRLVYSPGDEAAIRRLLKAIKRPFSYRVKTHLGQTRSTLLEQLTVRDQGGTESFRFWQQGPGYDRNLTSPSTVLAALDYIHLNPVRRKLCNSAIDWKWSSARHYASYQNGRDPDLPRIHQLPAEYLT